MGNMIDYVKEYGIYSFQELPFGEVDSLVLSQLSYLKLDGLVPGLSEAEAPVLLAELPVEGNEGLIFADERYAQVNRQLFAAMRTSRRFSAMELNGYVNEIDEEHESQFAAITCITDTGDVYVAYRGTDETLIGWREDFNMAFSVPVWGQRRSASYLEEVAARIPGRLLLGGHSKGGNFAVYAAMCAGSAIQARIQKVYSHDGPGFRPEFLADGAYERIAGRVCKIIPQSSVVGMILESHEEYTVVKSSSFGLLQHNPYTWLVENGRFVKAEDVYQGRKLLDEVVNRWILSLEKEKVRSFVEALFQVLEASEAKTLLDFDGEWKKSVGRMLEAARDADDAEKDMIKQVLQAFLRTAVLVAREHSSRK